jgi:hypothetical protein
MNDPSGTPQSSNTTSNDDALRQIRRGVIAGYVLAAMNAFLAWYIFTTGYSVNEASGDDRIVIATSTLLVAVVAAVVSLRFSRKHSIFIPIMLLAWLLFETIAKFQNGKPAPERLVVAGLLFFGLISGVRGAWSLRQQKMSNDAGSS